MYGYVFITSDILAHLRTLSTLIFLYFFFFWFWHLSIESSLALSFHSMIFDFVYARFCPSSSSPMQRPKLIISIVYWQYIYQNWNFHCSPFSQSVRTNIHSTHRAYWTKSAPIDCATASCDSGTEKAIRFRGENGITTVTNDLSQFVTEWASEKERPKESSAIAVCECVCVELDEERETMTMTSSL